MRIYYEIQIDDDHVIKDSKYLSQAIHLWAKINTIRSQLDHANMTSSIDSDHNVNYHG